MATRGLDNDTRGWIMSLVSGAACVVGATIICVDLVIRLLPGRRGFRIQDSSTFLACSLSLSFGVMLFSALYSMLPSSKRYLLKSGMAEQTAGFIMMACFIGGFIGIQVVSRFLHQFMPSHVVDCDHTHDEEAIDHVASQHVSRRPSRVRRISSRETPAKIATIAEANGAINGAATESTPLLPSEQDPNSRPEPPPRDASARSDGIANLTSRPTGLRVDSAMGDSQRTDSYTTLPPFHTPKVLSRAPTNQSRRPSMMQFRDRVVSFVTDRKTNCDQYGPCYGYSDPCGQECFKHIGHLGSRASVASHLPRFLRTTTSLLTHANLPTTADFTRGRRSPRPDDGLPGSSCVSPAYRTSRAVSRDSNYTPHDPADHEEMGEGDEDDTASLCASAMSGDKESHHHHVPANAFLAIGLQTVIAIALHKFPEGFITYATNHANPHLGFNVFMALFVHNIAEGFAMALPLYMALGSRLAAIAWTSLLGGLSQPLGAAVAVLWFRLADRGHFAVDNVAYACLFAVTAGIMTSVALQLFVESLSLNHNRNLSILCAFLGMTLLGVSNALVAD